MIMPPTNNQLKELLYLEKRIKRLSEKVAEIRAECRMYGSFSTDEYVCVVYEQERISLLGLKEVEKVLGREILEDSGLIRTTVSKIVKVTELVPK